MGGTLSASKNFALSPPLPRERLFGMTDFFDLRLAEVPVMIAHLSPDIFYFRHEARHRYIRIRAVSVDERALQAVGGLEDVHNRIVARVVLTFKPAKIYDLHLFGAV